ncbi:TetR/AcrR family transcriptional regulator [Olsenella uli]|uniref:TetR/AcrR family transcriptional regulator n=1 Tax=Olsenella uli TaxID=133926 RepID=UPI0019561B75|nr:TetR/AcrR family transcriptional regulator [Olsenella uli]MBM6816907.1 TetR/AcrR family transcriptional regulator [Olsenella uli]
MDLRTRKTLRALREAFLALRRERPLERISVRELCERAEVSKATFYLHYHSIVELSSELQDELVGQVVDGLSAPDGFLRDARAFVRELFSAFVARGDEVDALFSRGQEHALVESVERALRRRVLETSPERAEDLRFNVLLAYQVHGSHAAYMRYARGVGEKDRQLVIDAIAEAAEAVAQL